MISINLNIKKNRNNCKKNIIIFIT